MNKTLLLLTSLLILNLGEPSSPAAASSCSNSGSQSEAGCGNTDGLLPTLMNELNSCAGDCAPAGLL
ncbi:MAG: hypothetical protein HYX35_00125 [Proteobacteria bacterium]|nr:hypothetical protein [Pseudomonadota bacterium]